MNLRIVKIILVMMIGIFISQPIVAAQAITNALSMYDQNIRVENAMSLESAIQQLEEQYGVTVLYESMLLENKSVSPSSMQATNLYEAFNNLLQPYALKYEQIGDRSFLLSNFESYARIVVAEDSVRGRVTDAENDERLPGVNIIIKGTMVGTSTDDEGRYSIMASDQDTLLFSYIGYQTMEIPVRGRSEINVEMPPKDIVGQEMVVVAYGEQSTETVTGSISSVSSEEISKAPVSSIGNALLGKTPGLQAIQTTSLPGESGPDIFIRGVSSLSPGSSHPIYVIDGVVVQNTRVFGDLEPSDIESINVLKDASATAVYGVEAANGVIVIRTKRGNRDQDTKISVNSSFGLQASTVTQQYVDSYTYARAYNEAQMTDGVDPGNFRFDSKALSAFKNNTYPIVYADMNWQDYLFEPVAPRTQTSINISGGTDRVRYFVSTGYLREVGFFKDFPESPTVVDFNPSYNRYNVRSNIDVDVTPTTLLSITAYGKVGNRVRSRSGSWLDLYASTPYSGAGVVDGKIVTSSRLYVAGRRQNVTPRLFGSGYNEIIGNTLNINLAGTQKLNFITKGLEFKMKGAYNSYFTQFKRRYKEWDYYQPFFRTDVDPTALGDSSVVYKKIGKNGILGYSEDYNTDRDWYIEGRLHYKRDFGPHAFEGLLLYNQRENFYPSSYTSIPRRLVSNVGRVNYNYKRRYLLEFSMGYNGSENFAEGLRFGFFPAASVGWILTNEPFMRNVEFFDFLKLRASYGLVGNDSGIGRFLYLPNEYNSSAGGYNFGIGVPQSEPGISEGRIGNQEVTWEKSEKQNYGIDMRFLEDRLELNFDYFHELRTDILATRNNVPNYVAADLPAANIGRVKNYGYEAQVNWRQQLGDFFYSIGGNVAFARNEILFMDEIDPQETYMRRTGQSVGQEFGYVFDGYYTEEQVADIGYGVAKPTWEVKPGFLKFKDLNGDGVIDSRDQAPVGYPEGTPEFVFGSSLNFGYKNIDLSMTWAAATNVSERIQYSPYQTPFGGDNNYSVMQWQWEGRWTPEKGQSAEYPRFSLEQTHQRNDKNSDFWMADASYLRLKNIEIGYNFGQQFLNGNLFGIRKARIYVNGYNLLTFSKMMDKYSIDPEQHATNYQAEYPIMKTYNFGIKLDF